MQDKLQEVTNAPVISEAPPASQIPATKNFTPADLPSAQQGNGDTTSTLEQLAREESLHTIMSAREEEYIKKHKDSDALRKRYQDERTSAAQIQKSVNKHVLKPLLAKRNANVPLDPAELQMILDYGAVQESDLIPKEKTRLNTFREQMSKVPDTEAKKLVADTLEAHAKLMFLNRDSASYNPDEYKSVSGEIRESLDLFYQAQTEGSIRGDLSGKDILEFMQEDIFVVAWQDRSATENMLGDHGVRHLIDHNIRIAMKLLDELAANGVKISAKDRLLVRKIMKYHDLGYAVDPVREAINTEGIRGQDAGHNVLAAKFVKEKVKNPDDLWNKIFNKDDIDLLHRGVLYHDVDVEGKASIEFSFDQEQNEEARRKNIESVVRTADNTHAFEDKLPELLYKFPESLKVMRLMQTAAEIGDTAAINELKISLDVIINQYQDLSDDDKIALKMAVKRLDPKNFNKSIDRICGNKPEVRIINGQLQILVEMSESHSRVVSIFFTEAQLQVREMIKDVFGQEPQIDGGTEFVSADGKVSFKITDEQGEKTYYQKALENVFLDDTNFATFVIKDRDWKLRLQGLRLERDTLQKDSDTMLLNLDEVNKINELRREALGKFL